MKSSSLFSLRFLRNVLIIIFGNFIYAVGVVFFILPSGLITGGTTGIGLIMNHFTGMDISIFVGIFNVAMFLLGALILGKEFALTTLVSTIFYPLLLGILQRAVGGFVLTRDLFLSALFGGLCIGISLAIIIRLGASTGGMDIPPLVLQKLFRIPALIDSLFSNVFIDSSFHTQTNRTQIKNTAAIAAALLYSFIHRGNWLIHFP